MADIKDTVASHISTNWNVAVTGGSGSVPTIDAVGPEDIIKPADYPEAVLVYNETVGYDRLYNQGSLGDRHTRVYIMLTASERSGCTKVHFRAFIDELKSVFGSAITGFDLQILDPEQNVTKSLGVGPGLYQATFVLHLWEYGVSTSSAAAGGSAGASYWDEYFVTTQASANLTNETVISTYLGALPDGVDLVPTNDAGIDVGTTTKRIGTAYIDTLVLTNALSDAYVADDITASNYVATAAHTKAAHDALALSHDSLSDVSEADHRTDENIQDLVGAMVSGNTETLIAVTYQDGDGTIDFVVDEASINHDALTNFNANEHFTEASISHDNIADVSADDHHNRSHAMTSTSDHTANTWKVFYTDGSGDIQELALGADGHVLTSTGAATAPAFEAAGGGTIDGGGTAGYLTAWTDADTLEDACITDAFLTAWYPIGSANRRFVEVFPTEDDFYGYRIGDREVSVNATGSPWITYFLVNYPTSIGGLKLYVDDIRYYLYDADASNYVTRVIGRATKDDGTRLDFIDDATDDTTTGERTVSNAAADDVSDYQHVSVQMQLEVATANEVGCSYVALEVYYDT